MQTIVLVLIGFGVFSLVLSLIYLTVLQIILEDRARHRRYEIMKDLANQLLSSLLKSKK